MPDPGVPTPPSPRPTSHTSTQEWRSFEVRMRRRRFERCVLRAEIALEAGFPDDARAALEEAKQLDPHAKEIAEVEALLAARPAPALVTQPSASRYGRYAAIAATAILVSAGAGWSIQNYLTRPVSGSAVAPIVSSTLATSSTAAATAKTAPPRDGAPSVQIRTERIVVGTVGAFGFERGRLETQLASVDPVVPAIVPARQNEMTTAPLDSPPVQAAERTVAPPAVEPVMNIPDEAPRVPSLPLSPVTPAALPTASAAAPPAPPIDERTRVRSVLARYEAAYSSLDAQAAQAVWPAVDRGALARAFGTLESQRLSLGRCDVNLSGSMARANCSGSATWTPKVGSGRTEARRWDFTLQNADGTWKIVSAQAR